MERLHRSTGEHLLIENDDRKECKRTCKNCPRIAAVNFSSPQNDNEKYQDQHTDDFRKAFASGIDFLFTPTTPTTAFKAGEKSEDPVAMYLADIFVCAVSLAGLPAMSIPIGRDQGLPVGGQIIAPYFEESAMLSVAGAVEQSLDARSEVRS